MADEEQLDEGGEESAAKGGGKGLILIIVAILALGGGGFGAWKVMSGKDAAKKDAKAEVLPPRYITIDPPFVVNFEAQSMVRFLQVTIGVMTRDVAIESMVKDNDPRVRNDLLMILANQTYATVSTVEGKETLRKRCLDSLKAIVVEMGGDPAKVEALYFTSFVMQ